MGTNFSLTATLEMLERTPALIYQQLESLSDTWLYRNEGGDTWTVYDVLGHLVHGEKTDWLIRVEIILSDSADKKFKPFDRFAQFKDAGKKTLDQLLVEFIQIRKSNLEKLKKLNIGKSDLLKTGFHPVFGTVSLSQLLATWMVHDLNHMNQINRIMAAQMKQEVGPWIEYLRILKEN